MTRNVRLVVLIGLLVVLLVALYLAFTVLFARIFLVTSLRPAPDTPTPAPTFTATSTATALVIAAEPAATATPLAPTATLVPISPTDTPTPTPSPTPTPVAPQVVAPNTVNVRSGPGTNYPVIGSLPSSTPLAVLGRSPDGGWWQVQLPESRTGWVAGSVVTAQNVEGVPVAEAPPPPPPPPTDTPVPAPTRPQFQFEPTGWFGDKNAGLTRFLGTITDANGNPVNGVAVRAECGTYSVISNPSGPVGGWTSNDGANDPPGFYDITIDRRPIPCKWILTVVYTEDGKTALQNLSQPTEVDVTVDESVITANWRKNW